MKQNPQTNRESVLARLRSEIYGGARAPGSRLVQTELAREYGVSATPVREAMRDLANEGLITVVAHRAARVRRLDPAEAVDINELRLLLEPYAARQAVERISADEVAELEDLHTRMSGVHSADWVELNHRFHMIIIEATRNPTLVGILTNLRNVSRFYFEAALRADGGDYAKRDLEHAEIIDCLRRRDAEGIEATMARHFSPSTELRRRLALLAE